MRAGHRDALPALDGNVDELVQLTIPYGRGLPASHLAPSDAQREMTARRGGGTCCDVNCLVLLASAVLALRLIATAPVLEPVPPPAPVGVYFCGPTRNGDLSNSYAAAWLATRGRFVKGVPLGMPFLKRFLSPGLMRRPGFNLSEHIDFRAVNMEGASYLMMRRASKNDRGALRTADAFDFYVEHLSAYERMVDLLSMEPAATRAAVVDAVVARLGAREARLRASFPRFLAPRPAGVAVMPFYGAGVATGHSTLELRELYLRLTLLSCARLFPNAAVAVATEADAARAAAAAESVARVVDVEILRLDAAIAAPEQLGIATVAEIQRRFATGDWTRHAHVLYTEGSTLQFEPGPVTKLGSGCRANSPVARRPLATQRGPGSDSRPSPQPQKHTQSWRSRRPRRSSTAGAT